MIHVIHDTYYTELKSSMKHLLCTMTT